MKSRFFRARARNRYFFPFVFKKTIPITMDYNPAFDAGLNSTKEIFA